MNNTNNQDNKKKKKGLLIVLIIILALLLIGIAAFTISNVVGKNAMHDYDDMTVTPSDSENIGNVENNGKTIEYKGETYNFNEDVTTLLLMGIDETDYEFEDKKEEEGPNGYMDAIYMAVIDTKEENVTVVSVPRNTLVDVDVYDKDDNLVETRNEQIFLSYNYNTKKEDAISNVITSLNRLFNGIKFDTYYAINQDAVETLNDAIGGVTLTPQVEFYSVNENKYIKPGKEFTLKGHDAVMYIRSREWEENEDEKDVYVENNRVSRQVQYMQEFSKQTWSSFKNDPTVIEDMYNAIKDNTTTNIDVTKFTYLATTAVAGLDSYKDVKYDIIPGELTKGDYHNDFTVDEDKLMELIINLYYEKAE